MSTETEALREQFEAWARKNEIEAERHKYAGDQYDDHAATSAWWAWRDAFQAGHAAAKAETADVGEPVAWAHFAENGNIRLWAPERPRDLDGNAAQPLFTAEQLAAAVAKERERAAQFCDRRQAELLALVPGARRSNVVRMHEACANTAEVLAQAIRAGAKA